MTTSQVNAKMIDDLRPWFLASKNPVVMAGLLDGLYKNLPGLIGYWPGSMTNNNGALMDDAPNHLHMTNNNTAVLASTLQGLRPYFDYNGSSQYHSYPDDAIVDILGNETHIDNKGLSMGAWVYPDEAGAGTTRRIIIKRSGQGAASAYAMSVNANDFANGFITEDTTFNIEIIISANTVNHDAWNLVGFTFDAGSNVNVFLNGEKTAGATTTTLINNSSAPLTIGASGTPSEYFDGKIARTFLCESAIPDDYMFVLYQFGKHLYNV